MRFAATPKKEDDAMHHDSFASTTRGLNRGTLPMGLWEKAKVLGVWNPTDIDFTQDAKDWQTLDDREQEMLMRLTSQFQAGEEAVTLDLLPLINVIANEGRIEEEMFLTSFLWEEAKHVDFFNRFLTEVTGHMGGLDAYMTPTYRTLFYETLPQTLSALRDDASPAAQVRASTLYNMVVEGMLAETGYHIYYAILDRRNIMPGQREGVTNIKRDESRHIAYGVFLISRLVAEDPSLWDVFQSYMNELMPTAVQLISETFVLYGDDVPFGLKESDFTDFAMLQFQKRYARVEKARGRSLEQLYGSPDLFMEKEVVLA
ncbi:MAG: R2-like ligand-binding oxidase [Candidatus Hydrogenedentales bacterium]